MELHTKLNIGDTVYKPMTTWTKEKQECPDCLGTKVWNTTTPAGETLAMGCGTCHLGFEGSTGYVSFHTYRPHVDILTIGLVRTETDGVVMRVEYMCEETGIRSGTLHTEQDLYTTYGAAMVQAEKLTKIAQRDFEDRESAGARKEKARQKRVSKSASQAGKAFFV